MLLRAHDHPAGGTCDCTAHGARATTQAAPGAWSAIAPALACAACPACLTTYAKLLSALGVGVGLSEAQHTAMLLVAVAASLALSAWRAWRTRRVWPLAIAALGAGLVLGGHQVDVHSVEWAGVLVLLAGGLSETFRLRRRGSPALATSE
jgi:hypothetical protein